MYEEVRNIDAIGKQPEAFKIMEETKDEIFRIRERLSPILRADIDRPQSVESASTQLTQELLMVLGLVKSLREDIYL